MSSWPARGTSYRTRLQTLRTAAAARKICAVEELHNGQQGLKHGVNGLQRENDLYACIILSLRVGGNGATSVLRGMSET